VNSRKLAVFQLRSIFSLLNYVKFVIYFLHEVALQICTVNTSRKAFCQMYAFERASYNFVMMERQRPGSRATTGPDAERAN
jgi:hypothetical protein